MSSGSAAIRTSSSSIIVRPLASSLVVQLLTGRAVPSDIPSEIHPHTLHSRHRQYHDPSDMERYLTFPEPHRIRYTTDEGVCIHDQYIQVRYEFTSVEGSIQFQGDVRRRDMINYFDVDVVWTNVHGRTDGFGKVKGIGAIQRLKMWRDRYTTFHSISVLANKTDGQYREYDVHLFEGELRGRDDRAKQVRLNVRGRRGSAPDENNPQRRFSFAQRVRPRVRSTGHAGHSPQESPGPSQASVDIKHLSIQFSSRSGTHAAEIHLGARATVKLMRGRLPTILGGVGIRAQHGSRFSGPPVPSESL